MKNPFHICRIQLQKKKSGVKRVKNMNMNDLYHMKLHKKQHKTKKRKKWKALREGVRWDRWGRRRVDLSWGSVKITKSK